MKDEFKRELIDTIGIFEHAFCKSEKCDCDECYICKLLLGEISLLGISIYGSEYDLPIDKISDEGKALLDKIYDNIFNKEDNNEIKQ